MAHEVGVGSDEAFYAATPPLEAKKMCLSQWAHEQSRGGAALNIRFLDVGKA